MLFADERANRPTLDALAPPTSTPSCAIVGHRRLLVLVAVTENVASWFAFVTTLTGCWVIPITPAEPRGAA